MLCAVYAKVSLSDLRENDFVILFFDTYRCAVRIAAPVSICSACADTNIDAIAIATIVDKVVSLINKLGQKNKNIIRSYKHIPNGVRLQI